MSQCYLIFGRWDEASFAFEIILTQCPLDAQHSHRIPIESNWKNWIFSPRTNETSNDLFRLISFFVWLTKSKWCQLESAEDRNSRICVALDTNARWCTMINSKSFACHKYTKHFLIRLKCFVCLLTWVSLFLSVETGVREKVSPNLIGVSMQRLAEAVVRAKPTEWSRKKHVKNVDDDGCRLFWVFCVIIHLNLCVRLGGGWCLFALFALVYVWVYRVQVCMRSSRISSTQTRWIFPRNEFYLKDFNGS